MKNKSVVRYYLVILFAIVISFFTNDFGLVDIQKTALVIAVGVDREQDDFVITTQIALPKPEESGEQSVEIVSKGKTVSEALEKINAKTGWYPKLVFCQLIVLGETAVERNVFECLNYFLRSEYITDDCLLATCQGSAQELLNSKNSVETLSGLAISKTLSTRAEEVGTVLPTTLLEFSKSYYGVMKSGYMPILKMENAQEQPLTKENENSSKTQKQMGQVRDESGKKDENKVFSASETALFKKGVKVETLTREETLAFAFVKSKLRLAPYSVEKTGEEYSFSVRRNNVKTSVSFEKNKRPKMEISLKVTAGLSDDNKPDDMEELINSPQIPSLALKEAEKNLQERIESIFEKSRAVGCDIFECVETLKRKEYKEYKEKKEFLLDEISPKVKVQFTTVR
jgi:spore germination protein KC